MNMGFFLGSIIGSMVLYVNMVSTIKRIKKDENTGANTVIGCICVAFIMYSVFII